VSVHRGRFILLAIGAINILAIVGIYQLDPEGFVAHPLDYLYRVVQLFTAEGDWTDGHESLPLALEIARFLAPIVAIASLIIIFAEGIWTGIVNMRVRMYSDHVVVIGLSSAAMVLIRSCHERKLSVVVIERDQTNLHIAECRSIYVPVLVGDGKKNDVLRRARTHLARCLISFINVDDDNVELSLRIQEVVETARSANIKPLKVVLQVKDMQLTSRLESYPKFFEHPQRMEVRFLNLDERAARSLFRDYFPDVYADALGMQGVHIVVVGYGEVGKHVVSTALRQAHYGNQVLLKVTVLDPDAERARDMFQLQCPEMAVAAEVRFEATDLSAELLRQQLDRLRLDDATMFVSCVGSDADNMSMALALRQLALLALVPNAPVFVALRHSRGLAQLVESGQGNPEIPDGLYPFGMIEQLMRVDRVVDERLDNIAIALHEKYLAGLGQQVALQSSHRPWGLLPEVFRKASRAEADHYRTKLRAAGYVMVRRATDFVFDEAEINRLAQMEKTRWNADRAVSGWVHGEQRSDLAKVHPNLKPWSATTQQDRTYDLASVGELPSILEDRLDAGVARQVVIGITGHRAHRLANHLQYVEQVVREQLNDIAAQYPGAEFMVLSALADGSDRLVADLALKTLDAQLCVALPLPYEIYKRSFGHVDHVSNEVSNEEFQHFVGRASLYFEMPLRFGGAQILEQDDEAGDSARSRQYALAGAYIVSRSHELIAIWDGKDARGEGGTGDVVKWRTSGVVPVEYRFEGHFFPPVEMSAPRVISIPDNGSPGTQDQREITRESVG